MKYQITEGKEALPSVTIEVV